MTVGLLPVGSLLLLLGCRFMGDRPRLSVWMIQGWLAAPVSFGALASTFAIWVVVVAQRQFDQTLPDADGKTLAQWVSVAVLGGVGWVILGPLADTSSWLWPAVIIGNSFRKSFKGRVGHSLVAYEAVYDERVLSASPPFEGWSFCACRRRAQLIKNALTTDGPAPSGNGGQQNAGNLK